MTGVTRGDLVSVVIPMFNASSFIEETLGSIARQTHTNIEVIVVDDGSTDDSGALVEGISPSLPIPVQLVSQSNGGVSRARNSGISASSGAFVAFLDADDLWDADKIERQLVLLAEHPDAIAAACPYRLLDSNTQALLGEVHPSWSESYVERWLKLSGPGPLLPSTLLMRREALASVGSFDEQLSTAADADFGLRVVLAGKVVVTPETLVTYRLSPGQMHRDDIRLARDYQQILEKDYVRQRPELRKQIAHNLQLHLVYRQWKEKLTFGTTCRLGGQLALHPVVAGLRMLRHLNGRQSSV